MDTQFVIIVLVGIWNALLWYVAVQSSVKRPTLLVAVNLVLNLAFFATHPVFRTYYTTPISMLTLWTLLFATILMRLEAQEADGPRPSEMLSRSGI